MLVTSRRPFYRCNSRSRLPARRSTVAAAAYVDTRTATTIASAPQASSSACNDSDFRLVSVKAAEVFIAPAPGKNLWIGGCSCDLAPKAVQFNMPEGTTLESNARMWKNVSGRVFLEAAPAPQCSSHPGRTLTYIDGVEVRPYTKYYVNPGCQVAFTVTAAAAATAGLGNMHPTAPDASVRPQRATEREEKWMGTEPAVQPLSRQVASFTVDYREPAVSDKIHAMLVNFGRVSTWQQSVLDKEALGRMEAATEQSVKCIYRLGM